MNTTHRTTRSRRITGVLVAAVVLGLLGASPAAAAAPGNDARTAAQPIGALPATVRGTTVGATLETDEPSSNCGRKLKGTVWYSFTATSSRSLLLALDAAGDMDATVEVFLRQRSQLSPIACLVTNARGEATLDVDQVRGNSYLIRVAPLFTSVADAFTMIVVEPDQPARPPGQRLPANGVAATVDRFANPDDAWSIVLRQGTTYRMNFVTKDDRCASVSLYRPGIKGFGGGAPLVRRRCDAHAVFAAPVSGRYSVHVQAPRASRDKLPYRLRIGVALADDTGPGVRMANDSTVKGSLHGSELDALDLYRFSLPQRSDVRVRLRAKSGLRLVLLGAGGRRLGNGQTLDVRLAKGHYYLAVRAADGANGTYALRLLARTITHARMFVNGRAKLSVAPGRAVALNLAVRPAVSGPTTLLVERFDPIDGWLFHARFHPAVAGGRASVSFTPPTVGRWRVTGTFDGTRRASPSFGGTAQLRVTERL
jgi:hypothetical protein